MPKMTEPVTRSGLRVRQFSLRSAWTLQTLISPASSPPETRAPLPLSSCRFPAVCSFGSPQRQRWPQLLACPPLADPGHLPLHRLMLLFDKDTDRHTRTFSPATAMSAGHLGQHAAWPRSPEARPPEALRQPSLWGSPPARPSCEPWRHSPGCMEKAATGQSGSGPARPCGPIRSWPPVGDHPSLVGDPETERLRSPLCCVFATRGGGGAE